MSRATIVTRVVAASSDEDRVIHRVHGGSHLVVLADGAGGMAGGRAAAEALVGNARAALHGRILKYVPESRFKTLALRRSPEEALDELVAAARLASGALQDDVAMVLIDRGKDFAQAAQAK